MKILLHYIGKQRDPHANHLTEDYVRRVSRYARIELREIQPARFDPWQKYPSATKILLDPAGKKFDSSQFAQFIAKAEREGRDLVFLVGGAAGFPEGWQGRPGVSLSLSALTLPHELARVVLAEQIYRAFTMLRGHPYPK
jgi:23S rRNA (pseudouridine1915-N3)-methyltransferase